MTASKFTLFAVGAINILRSGCIVAAICALLAGCVLDPGTDSIFGTKYDRFVDRMYACARSNAADSHCMNFYLDEVLYDAPKALNGDRLYIVPIKSDTKVEKDGRLIGEGATNMLDNWIVIRARPSASHMIATLEDELGHQKGKRHPNDTTGPARDERAERMMSERATNLERLGMRDSLR